MLESTLTRREELAAMVQELQINRTVLDGLTNWFSVFEFTGGGVPTAQWDVGATTAYLGHPAVADGLSTSELERYGRLVQTIGDLGYPATEGPRTLKCRHSLGARFDLAAAELRLVSNALESSMTKTMKAV